MNDNKPALSVEVAGISKNYGPVRVLERVELSIRRGEFLTLLGPSGSGKTTLLTILAGFTSPAAGRVFFGDKDVTFVPPHRRNIGMVFQKYALFPHLSVAGNVEYPLRMRGIDRRERRLKIEAALDLVALAGFGERRIDELSGGQQQRVALARAIVSEPPILLMDEPLSALDKNLRDRMQMELRALHDRLGITTVYVTHDQREALTMSDRIAVMNKGSIAQLGTPQEIYRAPASRFVGEFIGESAFLPLKARDGRLAIGDVLLPAGYVDDGEPRALLVRPEHLVILPTGEPDEPMLRFEGHVHNQVYRGESHLLGVSIPDVGTVMVIGPAGGPVPGTGDTIRLGLRERDICIV